MLSEIFFLRLECVRRAQAEPPKPANSSGFVPIALPPKS
jgi:hypothetical protein